MKVRVLLCMLMGMVFAACLTSCSTTRETTHTGSAVSSRTSSHPTFMSGSYMAAHQQKVTIESVAPGKKNTDAVAAVPAKREKGSGQRLSIDSMLFSVARNERAEAKEVEVPHVDLPVPKVAKEEPYFRTEMSAKEVEQKTSRFFEGNNDDVLFKYAAMIETEPADMSNRPLFSFIDNWYGTPYKYGGNDHYGIDCSAFSQKLYNNVYGIDLLRTARQQHRHCERIRHYDDAEEGDLVFFHIRSLRVSHVGIYLANGYFVHASRSQGVMISNLKSRYWHRRYSGCGRIEKEDRGTAESDYIP